MSNRDIQPQPLYDKPKFYESPSNSAYASKLLGNYNAYDNLLRFVGTKKVAVTVEPVDFYLVDITTTEATIEHGVVSGIPFVFMYRGSIEQELYSFIEPTITSTTATAKIVNVADPVGSTFDVIFYVFEILTRD